MESLSLGININTTIVVWVRGKWGTSHTNRGDRGPGGVSGNGPANDPCTRVVAYDLRGIKGPGHDNETVRPDNDSED